MWESNCTNIGITNKQSIYTKIKIGVTNKKHMQPEADFGCEFFVSNSLW